MSPAGGAFLPAGDPSQVLDWRCNDCGSSLRIRQDNAARLVRAAAFAHGSTSLEINVDAMPAVDWTADVPDEVIAQAAVVAVRSQRA